MPLIGCHWLLVKEKIWCEFDDFFYCPQLEKITHINGINDNHFIACQAGCNDRGLPECFGQLLKPTDGMGGCIIEAKVTIHIHICGTNIYSLRQKHGVKSKTSSWSGKWSISHKNWNQEAVCSFCCGFFTFAYAAWDQGEYEERNKFDNFHALACVLTMSSISGLTAEEIHGKAMRKQPGWATTQWD